MPQTRVSAFGSSSYMATNIVSDTATVSGVSLAFLPSADRVRKARLTFTVPATADTYDVTIEFNDAVFEEYTMTGERKEP